MSITISKILEDVKLLSAKERAFIARCLISSLETTEDENIDNKWATLAKERFEEIKSGSVQTVSWEKIKNDISS